MTAYTGCDPGKGSGAVVQLGSNARTVEGWVAYQHMTKRKGKPDAWRVRWWLQGEGFKPGVASDEFQLYSMLCRFIGGYSSRTLKLYGHSDSLATVEGVFVPMWAGQSNRRNKNGSQRKVRFQDSIKLAESAGALVVTLEPIAGRPVCRVIANTWRPAVAGIPAKTDAKVAGKLAVQYARAAFDWPEWPGSMLTKEEIEAVCEAAFIGKYGARYGDRR